MPNTMRIVVEDPRDPYTGEILLPVLVERETRAVQLALKVEELFPGLFDDVVVVGEHEEELFH